MEGKIAAPPGLKSRWTKARNHLGMTDLFADGRHFQLIFLGTFLTYGLTQLGWVLEWHRYLILVLGCLGTQALGIMWLGLPFSSLKSAWISSMSLSLLLKANAPITLLLAAVLSIGNKLLIRRKGKQVWNPTNFGIIATILLTGDAWISPGQWGSGVTVFALISVLGMAVLMKVGRLDTGILFLAVFAGMEFFRLYLWLGWPLDYWTHLFTSGSLLVFSFFMITDPMSIPDHPWARRLWVVAVAVLAWYLAVYQFVNGAPLWALFFLSPVVPVLDHFFPYQRFTWKKP